MSIRFAPWLVALAIVVFGCGGAGAPGSAGDAADAAADVALPPFDAGDVGGAEPEVVEPVVDAADGIATAVDAVERVPDAVDVADIPPPIDASPEVFFDAPPDVGVAVDSADVRWIEDVPVDAVDAVEDLPWVEDVPADVGPDAADVAADDVPPDVAPDAPCTGEVCPCPAPCETQVCGADPCGTVCGFCERWERCAEGDCEAAYPPPPYGTDLGETMADHRFVDPDTGEALELSAFWNDDRLLLITFNAGWCHVCREDTALLNAWLDGYGPDGLSILSVLYETYSEAPATAAYAQSWMSLYDVRYPFAIDTAYADPAGEAQGGALGLYVVPSGPIPDNTFPVTFLVCPSDMRILYLRAGFFEEEVEALVTDYLYTTDCRVP